ncbi:MAG: hypothetical protein JXQ65_07285 [Candidatus Marinimicrobia bacterium]|nr:hypothetical protein [Candidatus Neomarinimicrobiota bacterium]
MRKIFITGMMVISIALALPLSIQRDIEVMESVLDKIIVEDSPIYFSYGNRFKGEYYENFGILLSCESSGILALTEIIEVQAEKIPYIVDSDSEKLIVKKQEKEIKSSIEEKQESVKNKLNETQQAMEDFMLNYARGALGLKDNEKIMVSIKFKNSIRDEKKLEIPAYLQMTAEVADLKKYYAGKMNEDKMRKALRYEAPLESPGNKDIEVMEGIFDTFLEKEKDLIGLRKATNGLYLEGFGAVFNIPVTSGRGILPMSMNFEVLEKKLQDGAKQIEIHAKTLEDKLRQLELKKEHAENQETEKQENEARKIEKEEFIWQENYDKNADSRVYVYKTDDNNPVTVDDDSMDIKVQVDISDDGNNIFVFGNQLKMTEARVDSIMNQTKDEVIKTLSIYGSTLKSVKDNENVIINLQWDSHEKDKDINLICSKKNIAEYSGGKIAYDAFVKNITIR